MTSTCACEDDRMEGERHWMSIQFKRPISSHGYAHYTWFLSFTY